MSLFGHGKEDTVKAEVINVKSLLTVRSGHRDIGRIVCRTRQRTAASARSRIRESVSPEIYEQYPSAWDLQELPGSDCQMRDQSRWPRGLLQTLNSLLFLALAIPTNALYFYIEGTSPKCFYEELPKDTMVVGTFSEPIWPANMRLTLHHRSLQSRKVRFEYQLLPSQLRRRHLGHRR